MCVSNVHVILRSTTGAGGRSVHRGEQRHGPAAFVGLRRASAVVGEAFAVLCSPPACLGGACGNSGDDDGSDAAATTGRTAGGDDHGHRRARPAGPTSPRTSPVEAPASPTPRSASRRSAPRPTTRSGTRACSTATRRASRPTSPSATTRAASTAGSRSSCRPSSTTSWPTTREGPRRSSRPTTPSPPSAPPRSPAAGPTSPTPASRSTRGASTREMAGKDGIFGYPGRALHRRARRRPPCLRRHAGGRHQRRRPRLRHLAQLEGLRQRHGGAIEPTASDTGQSVGYVNARDRDHRGLGRLELRRAWRRSWGRRPGLADSMIPSGGPSAF